MKRLIFFLVVTLAAFAANAQQPVSWQASAKALKDNLFEIRLTAVISEGWYIYSQYMSGEGPLPTVISYGKADLVDTVGKAVEIGKVNQKFDSQSGTDIKVFYDKVEFVQRVAVKGKLPISLDGEVFYMGCNAQMCLPPQVERFTVLLK